MKASDMFKCVYFGFMFYLMFRIRHQPYLLQFWFWLFDSIAAYNPWNGFCQPSFPTKSFLITNLSITFLVSCYFNSISPCFPPINTVTKTCLSKLTSLSLLNWSLIILVWQIQRNLKRGFLSLLKLNLQNEKKNYMTSKEAWWIRWQDRRLRT